MAFRPLESVLVATLLLYSSRLPTDGESFVLPLLLNPSIDGSGEGLATAAAPAVADVYGSGGGAPT